jgi:hypothetical protein
MSFRQITRLPSTSGAPRTLPGSYPPALSVGPDLGEAGRSRRLPGHWPPDASSDVLAMALAEPGRAQDGAGAVIPGYGHVSMVFVHPDIRGRASAASCCRDSTSVHRTEARAVRRCGPARRTCALAACTKAGDTERQVARPRLATVIPSSSSSVKRADPRRAVEDRAPGMSTLNRTLQQ